MSKSNPTPLKWMGQTVEQEHILRYIDRENPVGEVTGVKPFGRRGLTVQDVYCLDHTFICQPDGTVRRLGEEVQVCAGTAEAEERLYDPAGKELRN